MRSPVRLRGASANKDSAGEAPCSGGARTRRRGADAAPSSKTRKAPVLSEGLLRCEVGARGFEPPTLCSQSRCSTRLSHAPMRVEVASHLALRRLRLQGHTMAFATMKRPKAEISNSSAARTRSIQRPASKKCRRFQSFPATCIPPLRQRANGIPVHFRVCKQKNP